ncbi:YrhB domain-containing protein [Streptomyces sp. NBC_00005]|uniref:YrhB domain-containing protein n=1 Tax=Streptomyces sp. NBC_00005 TaxID=2903609 RepID=UPI00324D722F
MRIRWSTERPVRDAARVIGGEAAVRAVEEQLERDYQQWRAVSVDAMRMAVVDVEEHELVWIVSWQSEGFVRTRNSAPPSWCSRSCRPAPTPPRGARRPVSGCVSGRG